MLSGYITCKQMNQLRCFHYKKIKLANCYLHKLVPVACMDHLSIDCRCSHLFAFDCTAIDFAASTELHSDRSRLNYYEITKIRNQNLEKPI